MVDVVLALALTVLGALSAALAGQLLLAELALPLLPVLALQGLVILVGLHALLAWRGQRWRDLRLPPLRLKDFGLGLLALGLVLLLNAAITLITYQLAPELMEAHQERLAGVGGMLAEGLPLGAVAALMLFVGFYEELLARGFLLTRCQTLLSGTWRPVLLSSLLFGLGHFYQGWLGIVQTALLGIVFARLALRWQTLWPLILAHATLNTLTIGLLRQIGTAA